MDSAIIPEFLGQMIPLAAGAQSVENPIDDRSQLNTSVTLDALGILSVQYLNSDLPHVIRDLPDRRLWLRWALPANWLVNTSTNAMISCRYIPATRLSDAITG